MPNWRKAILFIDKYADHATNISFLRNVNAVFLRAICHSVWQTADMCWMCEGKVYRLIQMVDNTMIHEWWMQDTCMTCIMTTVYVLPLINMGGRQEIWKQGQRHVTWQAGAVTPGYAEDFSCTNMWEHRITIMMTTYYSLPGNRVNGRYTQHHC